MATRGVRIEKADVNYRALAISARAWGGKSLLLYAITVVIKATISPVVREERKLTGVHKPVVVVAVFVVGDVTDGGDTSFGCLLGIAEPVAVSVAVEGILGCTFVDLSVAIVVFPVANFNPWLKTLGAGNDAIGASVEPCRAQAGLPCVAGLSLLGVGLVDEAIAVIVDLVAGLCLGQDLVHTRAPLFGAGARLDAFFANTFVLLGVESIETLARLSWVADVLAVLVDLSVAIVVFAVAACL